MPKLGLGLGPKRSHVSGGGSYPLLDFDLTRSQLDPRLSFSRASKAWDNNFVEHGPDIPRISTAGLLIEGQRQNLCPYSDFALGWSSPTGEGQSMVKGIDDPAGGSAAITLFDESALSRSPVGSPNIDYPAGRFVHSVYVKKDADTDSMEAVHHCYHGSGVFSGIAISPATGTYGSAFTTPETMGSLDVGDWWRIWFVTNDRPLTKIDLAAALVTMESMQSVTYAFVQSEIGDHPSSYIPTHSTALTRSADIIGLPLESWFDQASGTMLVEFTRSVRLQASEIARVLSLRDEAGANELAVTLDGGAGTVAAKIDQTSVSSGVPFTVGAVHKAVLSWEGSTVDIAVDGILASHDSLTLPIGLSALEIGSNSGENALFGSVRRVAYWPEKRSQQDLLALTV